jgi:hypothetical protein
VIVIYIVMAIVVPEAPLEGEPESPRALTGEEISAGAHGLARDIQAAANKLVGGAAGTAGSASGAMSGEPTGAAPSAQSPGDAATEDGAGEQGSGPDAPAAGPAAPSPASRQDGAHSRTTTSEHHPANTGAILVGALLIAFGLLVFIQRTVGLDLLTWAWRIFVPAVIILLGVLILIRAMRRG